MAITYKLSRWTACVAVAATGLTATASAQVPKEGDTSVGIPATSLRYRSVLERYQSYKEQPVQSWRDANDNVGRIGGWRVYAKEAAPPAEGTVDERAVDSHTGHPRGKP